jgi:hypothetical protein
MSTEQKIRDALKKMTEERLEEQKDILRLGELISFLEDCQEDLYISFDFCDFVPGDIMSYRGYYEDLAIGYLEDRNGLKVSTFLGALNKVRNTTLEGYKGGHFLMHDDVPVWVANYGCSHETAVIGIKHSEHGIIIETAHID